MRKAIFLLTAALSFIVRAETQSQELTPSQAKIAWDGWDVTITRLVFTHSVKQSYGEPKVADSDSEFVDLGLTVTNSSHKGQSFVPQNCIKIIIGENAFDAEDIDVEMNYSRNIEPTLTRNRECYFELPKALIKEAIVIRFQSFLSNMDIPVALNKWTDEDIRVQNDRAFQNAPARPRIRAETLALSDDEALAEFNALQDRHHRPRTWRVHYDSRTDSYNWIGPSKGQRMSLPRLEFERQMRD